MLSKKIVSILSILVVMTTILFTGCNSNKNVNSGDVNNNKSIT